MTALRSGELARRRPAGATHEGHPLRIEPISGGCFTAIVAPDGSLIGELLCAGEGFVVADLDFSLIDRRKHLMDSRGPYSRPELLSVITPICHEFWLRFEGLRLAGLRRSGPLRRLVVVK